MKELTREQMLERIEANKMVADAYKRLAEAKSKLWELERETLDCEWRNTKMEYWKDICAKYSENKLLNCFGDIFYIVAKDGTNYLGRRVLWNLDLSDEQYEIEEIIETDDYGDFVSCDYEVNVIK